MGRKILSIGTCLLCLVALATPVVAGQFGLFSYEVYNGEITITGYPKDAVGAVEIPAEIEGMPVIAIRDGSFQGCAALTGIRIPASVTSISDTGGWFAGGYADGISSFDGCERLQSITVEAGNPRFSSLDGVLFDATGVALFYYPRGRTGHYSIPEGVVVIAGQHDSGFEGLWGSGAFEGCLGLTGIDFPASIVTIGEAAFSGCSGLSGNFAVPEGLSYIDRSLFAGCSGLVSLTIPTSVRSIWPSAFYGCPKLQSIEVAPGNPVFASVDGVLFNAEMTELLRYPEGKIGDYRIPDGVTGIMGGPAFESCSGLTTLTIPASLREIGAALDNCANRGCLKIWVKQFVGCASLESVVFLGDAPRVGGHGRPGIEIDAAPELKVYYRSDSVGFTSPTWHGHPTVMIEDEVSAAAPWLEGRGLRPDTSLHQDLNGDGVSLLMAYALDLDPRNNLGGSLPKPVVDRKTLSMEFYAASPGITYRIESSKDLLNWKSGDVNLSEPDPENRRRASVGLDSESRFLRLVVED
jgi:hypothetical protein